MDPGERSGRGHEAPPDRERFFHFLVEGRGRLQFFWNVVFAAASVEEARSRAKRYFENQGLELVGFDEEETKEVDISALPSAWLGAGRPDLHLAAAAGRIWVDPSIEGNPGALSRIAAQVLVLWYAAQAALSRFVGTCTMGDTDRFVWGMIVGAPAALLALALIRRPVGAHPGRTSLVAPLLAAVVVLCLYVPLAASVSVAGHHLCGAEFDEYLSATRWWERFIPAMHVVLASTLLIATVRTFVHGSRQGEIDTTAVR